MGAKTTQPLLQARAVVSQHVCGADLGPPEDGEGARWQQKALCPVALRSPSGGDEDVRCLGRSSGSRLAAGQIRYRGDT